MMLRADIQLRVGAFYYNVITHRSPCEKLRSDSMCHSEERGAWKNILLRAVPLQLYQVITYLCQLFILSSLQEDAKNQLSVQNETALNNTHQRLELCQAKSVNLTRYLLLYLRKLIITRLRTLRFLVHI